MRNKLLFPLLVVALAYATPSFAVCGSCLFDEMSPDGVCIPEQGLGTRCNNFTHPCVEIPDTLCDPKGGGHLAAAPSLASRYELASVEVQRGNGAPRLAQARVAQRVVASLNR